MNRKTGHTSYAYWQKDKNVHSLGFTHNPFDKADKQKLSHNINPNDTTDCYVKTKVERQKYNTYREKEEYKNYRIHKSDKPKIENIIFHNKKKGK